MSPCALGAAAYPPSLTLLAIANSVQLAEFCALVVPNIWAGSFARPPSFAVNTKRHATFTMFCQKVLKATQISCACVLLALYYIHQLRAAYPSIHASAGSEVRLFTTAIILANKFLDDNTFTNKTWSEVSSIPVQELNIMEMEFLSALNHNIYIDHQQFFAWVAQCQNWLPVTKSMRTIKMPAHLAIKPRATTPTTSSTTTTTTTPPALAASSSMPDIFHQHDNSTPAITTSTTTTYPRVTKRRTQEEPSPYQEPSGKRRYHVPYTPPDECIAYHHQHHRQHPIIIPVNNSCPQTPLYNTPQSQTDYSCRPVLSWSSSSSALASSRHVAPTTTVYSAASSVATAAAAAAAAAAAVNSGYPTSLLAAKVQCLRIE